MRYRAVSFDAAGTLVRVRWDPSQIAVEAAQAAGLPISDRAAAQKTYESILRDRWHVFVRLNLQRSQEVCDRFWLDMSHDWLAAIGADVARAQELYDIAQAQVFGQDTGVFSLYPDTLPALEALKSAGIPMIVVSNWDVSLHRVLRLLGLTGHFRTVVASLEEGVEKPDPKLFDIAVSRLDIDPAQILHVGDDPIADVQGALGAGLGALLLDRSLSSETPTAVTSLESVLARL